jgi:hypothetical protein
MWRFYVFFLVINKHTSIKQNKQTKWLTGFNFESTCTLQNMLGATSWFQSVKDISILANIKIT